jgi:hypothetical protein
VGKAGSVVALLFPRLRFQHIVNHGLLKRRRLHQETAHKRGALHWVLRW